MDVTLPPARVLRFGLFQLDPGTGELVRNGRRVHLQDQPLRVLTLLVERPGHIVTREELRQKLWPADTFVDFDDGLNAAVKKLRSSLGDSSDNPTFIETIPRRGYRFIASVVAEGGGASETAAEPGPAIPRRRWVAGRAAWVGLAVAAIVAAAAVIESRRASPPAAAAELTPVRSIVVLPLEDLSRDPGQQYFADGMTDELITRLAALEGIRVISRTSAMTFRGSKKRLPQIAAELGVDAVVEGSVAHSGNRVRITAQLVHGATDRHLWAESFERDERDVLELQNEVAREIARKVSATLRPRAAASARPIDPEAHRAYLRGRYRWYTRRNDELPKAVADFERAVALEPGYARAHAGLADVYLVLPFLTRTTQEEAYPKAREAAARALALDGTLAEAHNSDAYVKMYLDWDFAGAERGFRKAIELNPSYATAHQWYAELLSYQRRHDEAWSAMRTALELDPLSAIMHHQAGQTLQQARRYDEALQEYENALVLDPSLFSSVGHAVAWAQVRTGRLTEAAPTFHRLLGGHPAGVRIAVAMAKAAAAGDVRAFRESQLETAGGYLRPYCQAATFNAALGRDDAAFDLLEEGIARRAECVLGVNVDPEWDHLRSHPRFVTALRKIGLTPASAVASAQTH